MQGIFISYRREDAAANAGRLYDRLASHFGEDRVFMDVEGLEPGVDFVEEIERRVGSCEVLIVMIGAGWLAADSAGNRRLDDPKDFVRIETATALARNIRVVPVLVNGAVMPREEHLPADLRPLARRQAIELTHKQWDATSAQLIRTLERILDGDSPLPVMGTRRRRRLWAIGGALALVVAAVAVYLSRPWEGAEKPVQQAERAPVPSPADKAAPRASEKTSPTEEQPPASPEKAAPTVEKAPATRDKTAQPVAEKPPATPDKTARMPEKAAPMPAKPPPSPEKTAPTTAKPLPPPEKSAPTTVKPPASPEKVASAAQKPPALPEKTASPDPAQTAKSPETPPVSIAVAPTPPVPAPVAPPAALPATLPRVGDSWEYRMRSKWQTVQPRTYTHRVTAVSAREVTQTISVDTNPEVAAARQSLTPDTRFVEWRGQGFYLLEFNPFLEAFGGLQNASTLQVPSMPAESSFYAGWYGRGRLRGAESVSVPAGTFKAFKLEIDSNRQPTESLGNRSREPTRAILTLWYAPDVKRIVKMVRLVMSDEGMHLDEDTYELLRYKVQ